MPCVKSENLTLELWFKRLWVLLGEVSVRIRWAVQQNFFSPFGSFILYPWLSPPLLFSASLHASLSLFFFHIQSLLPCFPSPSTASLSPPLASVSSLSVYQWDISALHLQCGSFVIGVNGLGRMKHCATLLEITICFVWDQWGDPGLVPAGDDGLMSHRKTIRNCQWENTSQRSINSDLILHFPQQNIYMLCA